MKKDVVIMVILCILLGAGIAYMWSQQDRIAPTITIPVAKINYIEGDSNSLLEGVKAHDDRDGDVSDSLYVKILADEDSGKVYAIYYAKDHSNNISKVTSEIEVGAVTPGAQLVEEETSEATLELTPEATPEMTPEAAQTPTASANDSTSPQITLTEDRVTVTRGTEINRLVYVKDIVDDKDDRVDLFRNIRIKGELDTATVGEYEIIYYVIDSDGNQSNEAKLTVIVE